MCAVRKILNLNIQENKLITLGVILSSVVCLSYFCSPVNTQEAVLKVDVSNVIQEDFLGVNAVYHGFAFMPFQVSLGMNDEDRAREFDRVAAMELNIARTWYRPDWACGDNLHNPFDWETVEMHAFYDWLTAMKERNVDVALQAGWWHTRDTYMGNEQPNPERDVAQFATWTAESLHQLRNVRGFTNIKYLVLFTEPLNYDSGKIPDGYTQEEYYAEVVRAIHVKLVAENLRYDVKLVGPNSGSTDSGAWVDWARDNLDDVIDIYSWHTYNGGKYSDNPPKEYEGWCDVVEAGKKKMIETGKPFWFDEYGANRPDESVRFRPDYGNYLAQAVAAFMNTGVQTSLIWILFDQKYGFDTTSKDSFYKGVHRWGLAKWPRDTVEDPTFPYPSWYSFSLMSKYLGGRGGTEVYKTAGDKGIHISAVRRPGGDWSFLIVNSNHEPCEFSVNLSQPLSISLYRYLYDPAVIEPTEEAAMIGFDKNLNNVESTFSDRLPSRGVAVYSTIQGEAATGR